MLLSIDAKAEAKRYAIIMQALGKADEIRPQQLDDLEEFLSGTGTPRFEGQEAISAVLRAPFLKSSAAIEIVPLARDIGAVMGNDIVRENADGRGFFDCADGLVHPDFEGMVGHGASPLVRFDGDVIPAA